MANSAVSPNSRLDKKHTVIILQWLIVIVTSYLMLFSEGQVSEDLLVYSLVVVLFTSALVLYRLPAQFFDHRYFDTTLLVADTILISTAIYMNRTIPWDLFLIYFFILLLAAIGTSLLRIVIGSAAVSLIYLALLVHEGKAMPQITTDLVIRIPFLFGVSVLYGYLSENANRERRRAEMAEQKERVKMDLVSSLAHDIKNPLGIIMGYAEMLTEFLEERNGEKEHLNLLERIQTSGQRIVNLVTGFLDASKAEAGKLEIAHRPVSFNTLLKDVVRQQEAELQRKQLTIELNLDEQLPEVMGDAAQLDRVFYNLIGNAIKFTPTGGKVCVFCKREDGHISVAVQDTGIGISQEELPLLFTQFKRLKGAAKIEGTGLGLFIVKTIVEAHKGSVRVESVDGQGSTFTVRIPIRS
ncbi:MAG: HAMP domain-containing histidine kinase [Deltaproteobacteria bacterium]|nr:HAMP domain-containing histidine kinase [Deltaproteobacteria bacterium]